MENIDWILDSGATYYMTYDKKLLLSMTHPYKKCVATANGITTPVVGAGTICLTPSLFLRHCLLVPSLSHYLLSITKATKQLNYVVLIYLLFYLLHAIQTRRSLGVTL